MMERFDNTKKFMVRTILRNDRLRTYEEYIRLAMEKDYEILGVLDFYLKKGEDGRYFVLRHDVDHNTVATRRMFETERNLGVKSTYYFRESTMDYGLIEEMEKYGFEVGFHYETIANYIKLHNLKSVDRETIFRCRKILKEEIRLYKQKFNLRSVCSHGAPENALVGVSNNVLLEGEDYSEYGIVVEAYDQMMYETIDAHIMDDNIRHNFGFHYTTNPIEAINDNMKKIVFLTHPHHWYETKKDKIRNIVAFMAGRSSIGSNRSFKRIATTK